MSGEVEMMSTMGDKAWSRPPITMDFQVPMRARHAARCRERAERGSAAAQAHGDAIAPARVAARPWTGARGRTGKLAVSFERRVRSSKAKTRASAWESHARMEGHARAHAPSCRAWELAWDSGVSRVLCAGLREEQLPDNQVGALHHQGGAVPAPHLRLAWGAPSGGRSPQRAQAAHPGPSSVGIHPFHLAARVPLPRKWNAHCCWRWGIMGRGARLTRAIPRTRGKARARRKVLGGVSRVPFTAAGRLTCV
eukprot:6212979-Pleurochrysis_carterae.AAC.1